ncbi:MAG: riboflavin synthase [Candidatus Omnitrophica bacterium]|nr:riboflavin synthase [Candidatus Omnitrophota bacterium]
MFTGVVEAQGVVRGLHSKKNGVTLELLLPSRFRLALGSSLCVDGVCLTVVQKKRGSTFFDLLRETRRRTHLGRLSRGSKVNLERPLPWGGRLDGHLVSGHVDGRGIILKARSSGREKSFLIRPPKKLLRFIREKGSIAVNGVSLTIGVVRKNQFWVHCVPTTLTRTNLKALKPKASVNLEADLLMKMCGQKRRISV